MQFMAIYVTVTIAVTVAYTKAGLISYTLVYDVSVGWRPPLRRSLDSIFLAAFQVFKQQQEQGYPRSSNRHSRK